MITTLNLQSFIQMKVLFLKCTFWSIHPDLFISKLINEMQFCWSLIYCCLRYGPLVRHWTMRYEAKHSYFKKLSQSIGNFINLPHTLAMRHQYFQCYLSTSTDDLNDIEVGPGKYYCHVCISASLIDLLHTNQEMLKPLTLFQKILKPKVYTSKIIFGNLAS